MMLGGWGRLGAVVAVVGVVAAGCSGQAGVSRDAGAQAQAGNPLDLAPLASAAGTGYPTAPVYRYSEVSASNGTARSVQPTLDSGKKGGNFTFKVTPLAPFTNPSDINWRFSFQSGTPKARYPNADDLKNGQSYLWEAVQNSQVVAGPLVFSIDVSDTDQQAGDDSTAVGVGLANGFAYYTWKSHSMDSASGSISLGLDYSPANQGWAGLPDGWRLVAPNAVGYDKLRVTSDGGRTLTASLHSKNGSWLAYTNKGNGYFQPIASARPAEQAPTGNYGVLVENGDGTFTLTSTDKAVITFGKPGSDGLGYVRSVTGSGREGINQAFDGSGRLVEVSDAVSGRKVALSYGGGDCPAYEGFIDVPDGLLCGIRFWDGSTVGVAYVGQSGAPRLARIADYADAEADGAQVTDLAFDAQGRLIAERSPVAAAAAASPAAADITGPDPAAPALLTQVAYDPDGRVGSITTPAPSIGGPRRSITYSYAIGSTTRTSDSGASSVLEFDPVTFQQTRQVENGTSVATITYGDKKHPTNPTKVVDAAGGITTSEYDAAGRLIKQTGPYMSGSSSGSAAEQTTRYDTVFTPGDGDPGSQGKPLVGLDVQYWGNPNWERFPATKELGPRPAPQDPIPGSLSLAWSVPPVPGQAAWSARLVGRLDLPKSGDEENPAQYKLQIMGSSPQMWVDDASCPQGWCVDTPEGPRGLRIDMAVNGAPGQLKLVYWKKKKKDAAYVGPTDVPMAWLSPAYGLTTEQAGRDGLSPEALARAESRNGNGWGRVLNRTGFEQPQVGQVSQAWNGAGQITTTQYETAPAQDGYDHGSRPLGAESAIQNAAREIGVIAPGDNRTAFGYWGNDERVDAGCGAGEQDQGGLPKTVSGPDSANGDGNGAAATTTTWHMADGSTAAAQTGDGPKLCYTYGKAMQVTSTFSADGAIKAEYDFAVGGNPLKASTTSKVEGQPARVSTITTDLLGRTVETTDGWGSTERTTYNADGRPVRVVTMTKSGYATTKTSSYNASGALTALCVYDSALDTLESCDPAGTPAPAVWARAGYGPGGRLAAVRYSNGTKGDIGYDGYEKQTSLIWTDGGGAAWKSTNDVSPSGRVLSAKLTGGGSRAKYDYTYDDAARLSRAVLDTDVAVPAKSWEYTYDAASNRTQQTINDSKRITYDYAPKGTRLTRVTGDPNLSGDVIYDGHGSITAIGKLAFTYTETGKVATITDSGQATTVAYDYDAVGAVLSKTTTKGATSTTIRYTLGGLLLNDGDQAYLQKLTLPGGATVQRQVSGPAATPAATGSQTWLHTSLSGDAMLATDAAGTPMRPPAAGLPGSSARAVPASPLMLYDPFGESLTQSPAPGSASTPQHGWRSRTGFEIEDLSAQVIPMAARVYLPALGRFTQVDPKVGGSANDYDYANQDPINGGDPTGADTAFWNKLWLGIASVAIGVVTGGIGTLAAAAAVGAAWSAAAVVATGVVVGAAMGAAANAANYALSSAVMNQPWTWKGFATQVTIGAIGGAITGGLGAIKVGQTQTAAALKTVPGAEAEIGGTGFKRTMAFARGRSMLSDAVDLSDEEGWASLVRVGNRNRLVDDVGKGLKNAWAKAFWKGQCTNSIKSMISSASAAGAKAAGYAADSTDKNVDGAIGAAGASLGELVSVAACG